MFVVPCRVVSCRSCCSAPPNLERGWSPNIDAEGERECNNDTIRSGPMGGGGGGGEVVELL